MLIQRSEPLLNRTIGSLTPVPFYAIVLHHTAFRITGRHVLEIQARQVSSDHQPAGSQNHAPRMRGRWLLLLLTSALLIGLTATVAWAGTNEPSYPDWLEPRGMSIVDLVGELPESTLKGSMISAGDLKGTPSGAMQ